MRGTRVLWVLLIFFIIQRENYIYIHPALFEVMRGFVWVS